MGPSYSYLTRRKGSFKFLYMAFPGKRTRIKRKNKKKKMGTESKAARRSQGTTPSIPATGPLKATRFGRPIKADKIVLH